MPGYGANLAKTAYCIYTCTMVKEYKGVLSYTCTCRYHWRGAPLLISDKQHIPLPEEVMCRSCGAPCVFELQLMPPLIYILQKNYHSNTECGDCGVEFGTILVYSCSRSCWEQGEGGFQQEIIIVQTDPDSDVISQFHN